MTTPDTTASDRKPIRRVVHNRVIGGGGAIFEVEDSRWGLRCAGRPFRYGLAVDRPNDEHRRDYTDADAEAVVEMANASGWITRDRRAEAQAQEHSRCGSARHPYDCGCGTL